MDGNDKERKPWVGTVPGILTGSAALLAALTTVYVNVRNDIRQQPAAVATTVPEAAGKGPAQAPRVAAAQRLRLVLDRVVVQHDGEMGRADWRFEVASDGQPLFVFDLDSLDDTGGRNVVVADRLKQAQASISPGDGQRIPLTVKAWRSGMFAAKTEPVAIGEGVLTEAGMQAPVAVKAAKEKKGAFTFYFTVTPEMD